MPDIPQNIQNQAALIQDRFNATVTETREDPDLTTDAKMRRLAGAWVDAEARMGTLRQSFEGGSQQSVESLTKQAFGATGASGADAISVRDADDRASRLEDADEALKLLRRAEGNGDTVLSRAIAQHAFGRRNDFFGGDWAGVVDAYSEAHPQVASKISELANLRSESIKSGFAAAFVFSIHKPSELDRMGLHAAQAMASK
ncbi:hypothetical protein [Nocardioides lianchengensis]|uniref:Uncharacterized protein n=1 Tax=Nocardioides lianchengensis TaxID=1045774 RepID=A0A1G6YHZ3_9ACTN|nr:hypothetical protein [Nocardioides lianchengensis]NYG09638.1 hypothetical protein [Nocardioides lianchengensis]SDD89932.1 hypothetical protein SAMN05421872_11254 [Nocardioides lianchengensis]